MGVFIREVGKMNYEQKLKSSGIYTKFIEKKYYGYALIIYSQWLVQFQFYKNECNIYIVCTGTVLYAMNISDKLEYVQSRWKMEAML